MRIATQTTGVRRACSTSPRKSARMLASQFSIALMVDVATDDVLEGDYDIAINDINDVSIESSEDYSVVE